MVRIKVCGITRAQDAAVAVRLGVDALGFVFASSPRQVTVERARDIISTLPPFVERVGVFVNAPAAVVRRTAAYCGLSCLQFHGDESSEYCAQFGGVVIKAFSVTDRLPPERKRYQVTAWLLDSGGPQIRGGTGKTFSWSVAAESGAQTVPIVLSGGLRPDNVCRAIRIVRPYAVDVSSGVETFPGVKSEARLRRFVEQVRRCDEKLSAT